MRRSSNRLADDISAAEAWGRSHVRAFVELLTWGLSDGVVLGGAVEVQS